MQDKKTILSSKDVVFAILIVCMIGYMILSAYTGYLKEERRKEAIRNDSLFSVMINRKVQILDSMNRVLYDRDSVLSDKISRQKQKVTITKKNYEKSSADIPVLPEF